MVINYKWYVPPHVQSRYKLIDISLTSDNVPPHIERGIDTSTKIAQRGLVIDYLEPCYIPWYFVPTTIGPHGTFRSLANN